MTETIEDKLPTPPRAGDRCWISVLIDVLHRFDGSVIGHPSELVRDGREACPDWLRLGWPATGTSLVQLLERHAEELLTIGLLVHHTPPGPGQPPWLAVNDLDSPPRVHLRLPAECYLPTPPARGHRKAGPRPARPNPTREREDDE
jgi:hypothetical protein